MILLSMNFDLASFNEDDEQIKQIQRGSSKKAGNTIQCFIFISYVMPCYEFLFTAYFFVCLLSPVLILFAIPHPL